MTILIATLISVKEDLVIARLKPGEEYRIKDMGLSIRLMDQSGALLLETASVSEKSIDVYVNKEKIIEVAQIRPGDLIDCGGQIYTVLTDRQAILTGRQRLSPPEEQIYQNPERSGAISVIAMLVYSMITLGTMIIFADLVSPDQDECSLVAKTPDELPVELGQRTPEQEKAAQSDYEKARSSLHSTMLPDAPISGSANEDEDLEISETKYLLKGHGIDPSLPTETSAPVANSNSPEETGSLPEPLPEEPANTSSGKITDPTPRETKAHETAEKEKKASRPENSNKKARQPEKSVSMEPASRDKTPQSLLISLLTRTDHAKAGNYEALRDIAAFLEEYGLSGSVLHSGDIEELWASWHKGSETAAALMRDEGTDERIRRLYLYLFIKYQKITPSGIRNAVNNYNQLLQKWYDEAMLISGLDPQKSQQKLRNLERLIPGIHPLSKQLRRDIKAKIP